MKLFFDESGYSGCIMPNKNGQLFNDGQRHFVLGSVFVADKEDEIEILNKYRQFKNRFGFTGEIKGSELMTQRNNEALKYFITNVLDDKHFFICNYDKMFYLSTLISVYIFGVPFQQQETLTLEESTGNILSGWFWGGSVFKYLKRNYWLMIRNFLLRKRSTKFVNS